MNVEQIKSLIAANLMLDTIVCDVSGICGELARGEHALGERLAPAYQVRDVRACPGFWNVPELIDDMIAMYVGSWTRMFLHQQNIDITKMSMNQMINIMESTDAVHKAAIEPTLAMNAKTLGVVKMDDKKIQTLLIKILGSQGFAGRQITKPQ